ncbi:MAG: isoamylase early set domain-containing protein [Chloroflexota bacterium]|nr:isoamylase early set domain-containing protein [Chloroflexota bacterium]
MFTKSDTDTVCRVTFSLPEEIWASEVYLVGDFNDWNRRSHPLQQDSNGRWVVVLDLPAGPAYGFRYFCDGEWLNDNQADAYWENPHGGHNSVLFTEVPSASDE